MCGDGGSIRGVGGESCDKKHGAYVCRFNFGHHLEDEERLEGGVGVGSTCGAVVSMLGEDSI